MPTRYLVRIHYSVFVSPFILFLCILQSQNCLWSQEVQYNQFTQEEAVSNTVVNTITRDHKGNMWFGTEDGLVRYNGHHYKVYSIDTHDAEGVSSNAVLSLYVDSTGYIWIGTFDGGLNRFDTSSETLVRYQRSSEETDRMGAHGIWSILPDKEGGLWLGTNEGLERFDPDTGSFKQYTFALGEEFSHGSRKVRALFQQEDGVLWLGTRQGIYLFDPTRSEVEHYLEENDQTSWEAVQVIPPFWSSWWFRIGGMVVVCVTLFGGFLLRYNKLKQNQVILEKTVEERTKELKVALREAERANETKTMFLENVSHDLRTPLTLILGPLEDLLNEQVGPIDRPVLQHLELMEKNTGRIFHLINDLLDYASIESGHFFPVKKSHDLVGMLQYLHGSFVPLAQKREIAFELVVPKEPVVFCFDRDHMERVFTNLLSNAFKYTPNKGRIQVHAWLEQDNKVRVTVQDSGIGIPSEKIEQVFDRFYRVRANNQEHGTGIGLSLSRELVTLHQGEILVESEEGKGSTFSVVLPLLNEETKGSAKVSKDPGLSYVDSHIRNMMPTLEEKKVDSTQEERPTILLVDDDHDVRRYLRIKLEEQYNVVEAVNGVEALEKTKIFLPDLVVCDVMMPKMNGVKFTNLMKTNPEINYLPVILLTANASSKLPGLELGADEFLIKPVDIEELVMRIDNLLATRRKLINRLSESGHKVSASKIAIASEDEAFLQKVQETIEAQMHDESFNVGTLAGLLAQSRTTLHRRLNQLLGMPPGELIKELRLQRATQLMKARSGPISDIAYSVGFKSVSHFSNSFSKRYGMPPSAYIANITAVN